MCSTVALPDGEVTLPVPDDEVEGEAGEPEQPASRNASRTVHARPRMVGRATGLPSCHFRGGCKRKNEPEPRNRKREGIGYGRGKGRRGRDRFGGRFRGRP